MKIALALRGLSETDTVILAGTIISALTGNGRFTPNPSTADLGGLRDAAKVGLDAVANARQAFTLAVTQKDNAIDALRNGLNVEASTIEAAVNLLPADQQQSAIESAGMKAQTAPARVTALDPVTDLSLTASDNPGALDWHCDPVDHARLYVVEYTTDPVSPAAKWQPARPSTKSSGEIAGLTSGTAVSVRVHAEGSRNVAGAPAIAGPKTVP